MKINLNRTDKNTAAVNAALVAVNGKATAFTITSWSEVEVIAKQAEDRLQNAGIPKASRGGTVVTYTPAGPDASAYKYAAKSTLISLVRGASEWFLTDVSEASVYPRATEKMIVTISPEQAEIITRHALAPFRVTAPATA